MKLSNCSSNTANDIFYNPTTCELSYNIGVTSTWSSGGSTICGHCAAGTAGSQNSGLVFGGCAPGSFYSVNTEEYNGSSWSLGGNLSTGTLFNSGAGTQNAALSMGGSTPSFGACVTEEYNGSSWAAGGLPPVWICGGSGTGTQNSALHVGSGQFNFRCCTQEYNGSSWALGGNTNCQHYCNMAGGTQNAAVTIGGFNDVSEEYNGSSWSTGATISSNSAALNCYNGGGDSQNTSYASHDSNVGTGTYCYNGSTWSLVSYLITGTAWRGTGNSSAGLAVGGTTCYCTCTYELNATPGVVTFNVGQCEIIPYG